jgi:hypothetical protein
MATLDDEATDLLQTMIRNQCVNDGRPNRVARSRTRRPGAYLAGPGTDTQYESYPGRGSMSPVPGQGSAGCRAS